ncbi:MAG: Dabb family protein [Clostridia bacterium]|nr:Dabb family protein [Clostridia bacterium]
MIEHVVMWKFKDGEGRTREENMAYVRERLLALPAIIPEIKLMQLGSDVSRTEMSYDMMLVTRFDSLMRCTPIRYTLRTWRFPSM